ncbi:UMP-CMP kinase 2, mitochondrial [Tachyglossus aculeatus]|uniref:UMP-CMP kinase 2, mitochondrial n=1 Tax=Tachyglossus aculeatus TaxID=9261 RepID=UPI0018F3F17E|nr:UMP-CMP kinase 2, mitochondrial [Tachyglossus aculeatus]
MLRRPPAAGTEPAAGTATQPPGTATQPAHLEEEEEREANGEAEVAALLGTAVFPSRRAAQRGLRQCLPLIPEAEAVLDLVDRCPEAGQKGRFPVIVIEGLDATGKTTVTQSVSEALNAVLLKTPPPCMDKWRKVFDKEPTIIKRAFYSLGNYIVASEIARASTHSPVIIDRYWHSTAAFAIATEVSGGLQNLPPAHHDVYQWPRDLLKPDLVLLLTLTPEERVRRIQGRGIEKTEEEMELEANALFRQKVEMSYQRMEHPGCQIVDASPSREKVLENVLHLIKGHYESM